jgi:hypothetical protein
MVRSRFVIGVVLLASLAYAKKAKTNQKGKLLQMESVACGVDENSGKTFVGEIIGTDGAHKKTHELLCQEYVLQSDKVIYRIRPRDEKHPVLLPVGEQAQFRLEKDKMILRVEDSDDKDRQYTVVSMTPRDDASPEKASLK